MTKKLIGIVVAVAVIVVIVVAALHHDRYESMLFREEPSESAVAGPQPQTGESDVETDSAAVRKIDTLGR